MFTNQEELQEGFTILHLPSNFWHCFEWSSFCKDYESWLLFQTNNMVCYKVRQTSKEVFTRVPVWPNSFWWFSILKVSDCHTWTHVLSPYMHTECFKIYEIFYINQKSARFYCCKKSNLNLWNFNIIQWFKSKCKINICRDIDKSN